MKKNIIILSLLFSYYANAQQVVGTTDLEEVHLLKSKVYNEVEKLAMFPEGINAFRQKIANNFRGKKVIAVQRTEQCELIFVIERDGTVTDIKATGSNESFNKEAIRAVSKIKGKWIPGEINDTKVRCRFRIPLTLTFE